MEAPARRPRPEPAHAGPDAAHAGPAQAGRPYRDFVEREAEQFRREIENDGSVNVPGQQETGAAALPELPRSQRSMPGPGSGPALSREHMAVIATQAYLVERGFIKPPYSRLEAYPNHAEALIQLADDIGTLVRETPAPTHPRARRRRTEAVIDRVLYVLQASASILTPGGMGRGFGHQ